MTPKTKVCSLYFEKNTNSNTYIARGLYAKTSVQILHFLHIRVRLLQTNLRNKQNENANSSSINSCAVNLQVEMKQPNRLHKKN